MNVSNNKKPLKRTPALVQFSKDHHFNLLLVWKIREGLRFNVDARRIGKFINFFFKSYVEDHFKEEEELLFIHLDKNDDLRLSAEKDHQILRDLNKKIFANSENILLQEFADTLEQHIRFEERILFAHLQDNLNEKKLNNIAEKMNSLHSGQKEENWQDVFWINKKSI